MITLLSIVKLLNFFIMDAYERFLVKEPPLEEQLKVKKFYLISEISKIIEECPKSFSSINIVIRNFDVIRKHYF